MGVLRMQNGRSNILDYTNVDYQGFKQMMIDVLGEFLPEYTDTSETDPGMVIYEAVARGLDILSFYQNSQANECFLSTAENRTNITKFCRMLDYHPRSATPAKYTQYFEIQADVGLVTIPVGYQLRTKEDKDLNSAEYFTVIRGLTIDTSRNLETQPGYVSTTQEQDGKAIAALFETEVAHGVLIDNEAVGSSDGITENLMVTLKETPVALPAYDDMGNALMPKRVPLDSFGERWGYEYPKDYDEARRFSVFIDGEEWYLKSSFVDSTATDKHFIADINEDNSVTLTFGDGINGAIPPASVIYASYRKGGGSPGNVGANTITVMPSPLVGILSTYNPEMAYSQGMDKETIKELKRNAPNSYKTRHTCIEDVDYAAKLYELYPQIFLTSSFRITDNKPNMKDLCFTLFEHYDVNLTTDELNYLLDTVQICVLMHDDITKPDGTYKKLKDFRPIEDYYNLRADMQSVLQERAMLGTHQLITGFKSKMISLKAVATVKTGYEEKESALEIKKSIANYLTEYFVIGSIEPGRTISLNDLEADIFSAITGLRAFRIQSFTVGDDPTERFDLDIPSDLWEIVELDDEKTAENITILNMKDGD